MFDDVVKVVDIAERLRHLLGPFALLVWAGLDHQVLDVHPEARELLSRRAFALRDFVLVVWKDQIDAAGVNVYRWRSEQAQRHGRALDMPARTTGANARIPCRLAFLGCLP